jgi:hypothetical protein
MWHVHKLNDRITRLEEDKSVLSAKVDELLKARGTTAADVVEEGNKTTPAAPKKA